MKKHSSSIFTSIGFLIFTILFVMGGVFIFITTLSATHYYEATTQLLNKDVAAHIAKFTSPYKGKGIDKKVADSVFYDAMVLSPTIEVYFLDPQGDVIYYQAPDSLIELKKIPLEPILKHLDSKGQDYIKGPDPKNADQKQVFSVAEVRNDTALLGYIYVILGSDEYRKASGSLFDNHVFSLSIQILVIVLLLSLLLSLFYLRRIRRNFRRFTTVVNQYQHGDYTARLETNSYNEFTAIGEGFNSMADSLVEAINRLQASAVERRNFIANISHDLRTPLSIASGYVEKLKEEIKTGKPNLEKQDKFVAMASRKIHQLESMVAQLFDLSRMESIEFKLNKEPLIISDIVEETVTNASKIAEENEIGLSCNGCQETYWIMADTGMMERLVQNLVDNALKYTPQKGFLRLSLASENNRLTIDIENSGNPFSQELLEWINTLPGETAVKPKPHSGLGLAIVVRILQLHYFNYRVFTDSKGMNHFQFQIPLYKA